MNANAVSRRGVPVRVRSRTEQPGLRWAAEGHRTACAAPSIQLRFDPNGLVTACCKSLQPLGHIGAERLGDIWEGAVRRRMVDALGEDDFSVGCQRCATEIRQEGREGSYPAAYDEWAGHLTEDPDSSAWPVRMEMNLSNACNLQCIQCDGDSSSAIRLHREKRAPLPKVYGDEFFADLLDFLPHLDRIVFAGGEPFLGPENFRVFDLVAEHAPHIDCTVITNATHWTPRIEALLERIRFSFVFSLDGITAETYESIRIGSDFSEVMANIERFTAYTEEIGTTATVNHCLMPQNAHEFGELLVWAEDRGLLVNVAVVRDPPHASIAALAPERIAEIDAALAAAEPVVRPKLHINRATWDGERERIAAWADHSSAPGGSEVQTVMFFRCAGTGPHDDRSASGELQAYAHDGVVHWFSVGPDGLIAACDDEFQPTSGPVVGQPVRALTDTLTDAFGPMNFYEVIATTEDRVDARVVFGDRPARVTTVAMRDAGGWADEARVLVALGPSPVT